MSDEDLKTYGITSQDDLERFQKRVNEQMGTTIEYEPLPDQVSPDVRAYLEAKGLAPKSTQNNNQTTPTESVISVDDINQFIQLQKSK